MLSKIGGGRHKQLALTMTSDEYAAHMGFAFVPSHNSGNYPPTIGNAQEQAPGTEKFRQHRHGLSFEEADRHGGVFSETVLGFVVTFQFRALVLGRTPCDLVSRQGCVTGQMRIMYVPCTPRL